MRPHIHTRTWNRNSYSLLFLCPCCRHQANSSSVGRLNVCAFEFRACKGERERDHGTLPCVRLKLVPSMSQVQAEPSTHTQTHTQTSGPWLDRGERERDHGTFSTAPPPAFDTHIQRLCAGEKVQILVSNNLSVLDSIGVVVKVSER